MFNLPQHLVIPLFQRPYVWEQDDQWGPLWHDVRRLTDILLAEPFADATHFLGAVVLQQAASAVGSMQVRNVIDGQQRLTTLQIFMDAANAVLDEVGADKWATQLEHLTHNDEVYVQVDDSRLKIRHANKDGVVFDEVMNAEPPINYAGLASAGSRIARAHAYFATEISQWLASPSSYSEEDRAEALVRVLTQHLQLVAIDLSAAEDSQAIFETLNARGTPLTAADLIRNYVFQRLDAEGADTGAAYSNSWPFETKFWEQEVSVGRQFVGRSSLFLNQWLASKTGEEVSPMSTFSRFKSYVEHETDKKMSDLLALIKRQAADYERWTVAAKDPTRQLNTVEMNFYRMQSAGIELLKPLIIWLHDPERNLSGPTIEKTVRAAESWVIRRMLLRLPGSDLGRIVADIIKAYSSVPDDELPERVRSHLGKLNVASTYWPGDDEVKRVIAGESVYRRWRRPRLRMVLEAIEDKYRAETGQSQLERKGYPIEHILPQSWEEHWKVVDPVGKQARADHVHLLGNLTLLTKKLNPKVSNKDWSEKAAAYLQHNTIKITGRLIAQDLKEWNESLIDLRTAQLTDEILAIWPVPHGHSGEIVDQKLNTSGWVEVKHLVAAGLLQPGDVLIPKPINLQDRSAVVTQDGRLEVEGSFFWSPSGAANHIRGTKTNGWKFWQMTDGRELAEVRTALGEKAVEIGE